ncbi:DUF2975 domain-containing protein [Sediminibacillus massiliensis]|uniref:DUF2975 domain-containing protein n=1 Tax=Sediminibacillus massiliensis TaxID=1926277 RepID=UPI0009886D3F|nr:DUF2975 domain-containing protein [Sediminibacillus massiliensis]
MKQAMTIFLKAALFFLAAALLILCVFWLPRLAQYTAEMFPEFSHLKYPVLSGIYITAIPFYFAFYQAYKLLNLIEKRSVFSETALSSLKRITLCAFTIILLYIIGIIYLATQSALHPGIVLVGFAIIFASLTIAVFCLVLRELLQTASQIKEENELTV